MPAQETKYQQVIDWVRENIENGTFREGDKLMSENEMSERFGLSRQTIRRATGELVRQNILTRQKGSGTYIANRPDIASYADAANGSVSARREPHHNIAVISTFNETYIFPRILKGIEGVLSVNGYAMQLSFTDNRLGREAAILEQLLEQDRIDGLIVEPVKSALPNPNIPFYQDLIRRGIPVIFFNAFYRDLEAPCVRIDDIAAAAQATELLINAGHRKIGAVFKSDDGQGPLRYQGYLRTVHDTGCRADQDSIIWVDSSASADMSEIAGYVFDRLKDCTGVVCYNDQIAYQLIETALERGMEIPKDLSVVGIDDSYLAGVCRVPFSSICHPKEALGECVARNLLQMIDDPLYNGNCLMKTEPVIRKSIAKL